MLSQMSEPGQSPSLAHGGMHKPPAGTSQFGKAPRRHSPLVVHGARQAPAVGLPESRSQFGSPTPVHSAWAVHDPMQTPPAPQFGSVASGQSVFAVQLASQILETGSQFGKPLTVQSLLVVHGA